MRERLQEQANMIMEDYDFSKTQSIMTHINAQWKIDGVMRVPAIQDIKAAASNLLNQAVESSNEDDVYCYNGLQVNKIQNVLELSYVPVSCSPFLSLLNG